MVKDISCFTLTPVRAAAQWSLYRSISRGLLPFLGMMLMGGCHPRDEQANGTLHLLMQTGFEEPSGWVSQMKPLLTTEKAHSGKYSLRVDEKHPSAVIYQKALGALCAHRPRQFRLSAWVWVPGLSNEVALQVSVYNPGNTQPVLNEPLYTTDARIFGKWYHVSQEYNLPNNTTSQSQFVISVIGEETTAPVYVDDLQLKERW
ncbi:hypothetical protein [Hymenobacter arizonensis]|uniref:CBM-cenC domain-containing protein n=1 Tax=Hymenobacter arizonensis TaxID=1227077 RepID=A0A1I6ASU2_HYMAR|nr:hypothetical protein [Hymenobacter arizonensis]SFQ71699.1 hypothetical protein SAMN04515668_3856 [Hymenobacter arizonensis]